MNGLTEILLGGRKGQRPNGQPPGKPATPQSDAARRRIADSMMRGIGRTPQTIGEGLHDLSGKTVGALLARQLREQEAVKQGEADAGFEALFGTPRRPQSRPDYGMTPTDQAELEGQLPDERVQTIQSMQQGMTPREALTPEGASPQELVAGAGDGALEGGEGFDYLRFLAQEPQYDLSGLPEGKLTEGQAKLVGFLRKAKFADAVMSDPRIAQAMTRMDNNIAGSLGAVGRLYTGSDYEIGRLMADTFSNALLRKESGAATPDHEVQRYNSRYFPLSNEGENEIMAKAALRKQEIRALENALGSALPVGQLIQDEINALVQGGHIQRPASDMTDEELLRILQGAGQ